MKTPRPLKRLITLLSVLGTVAAFAGGDQPVALQHSEQVIVPQASTFAVLGLVWGALLFRRRE